MDTTQRIFFIMQERGLTAYRVSKATGISTGNFSDWKSGKAKPGHRALQKLSSYFGVSIDYLSGHTDDPAPPEVLTADALPDYAVMHVESDKLLSIVETKLRKLDERDLLMVNAYVDSLIYKYKE